MKHLPLSIGLTDTLPPGDSLDKYFRVPGSFEKLLCKWLKHAFGRSFKSLGNCVPHATQEDSHSCAFVTVNTIDHCVSGVPVWEPKHAARDRVHWFLKLSRRHLDFVKRQVC